MMEPVITAPAMIEPPAHYPRYRTLEDVLEVKTAQEIQKTYHLYDGAAKTGLAIVGGPGSGKSLYMGRYLAWDLLKRQKATLLLDPTGGACDHLLNKIVRLPLMLRDEYCQRLQYINTAHQKAIVPTPLLTRHGETDTSSVEEIVNRILVVWETLDPYLETASVWGKNSLEECGGYGGQIAVALGLQLDFVADLVRYTKTYESLLTQLWRDYPALRDAVHYFQTLSKASHSERARLTESFLRKTRMLLTDPIMRATFCAARRGVDWRAVVQNGLTVVVDFRHELDQQRRRFKLLWWLKDFMTFIKQRGAAGRDHEVTLIIDELSQLLGYQTMNGESVLAQDIEELTTVFGRAYGVNVVLALQGLDMVAPRIRSALMRLGSQMIGRLANPEDALLVARQFKNYDPAQVRKQEPVWMNVEKSVMGDRGSYTYHTPQVIDYRTTEYTADEQYILFADRLRRLSPFECLLRPSVAEGQLSDELWTINVDTDPGEYPHEPYLAAFREQLQAGQPVEELLQEIEERKPPAQAQPQKKPAPMKRKKDEKAGSTSLDDERSTDSSDHGILTERNPAHDAHHSVPAEKAPSPPARADEDNPWR